MSRAQRILRGSLEAARVLRRCDVDVESIRRTGRIDVFEIACRLDVPLLLRPLEGLLGAYLPRPSPGILVTTKRPRTVQRFTAAHELGHHILDHAASLDSDEILRRAPLSDTQAVDLQELEANVFAGALLLPRWLLNHHCERQGWTDRDLHDPNVVYQLSLRTGTSFEASCWTLARYKAITVQIARTLLGWSVRSLKQSLLHGYEPRDFYGDVWRLTPSDEGMHLEGGSSDKLVFVLHEHAAGGFRWVFEGLGTETFPIVQDARQPSGDDAEEWGSPLLRRIIAESRETQSGVLRLSEARPWESEKRLADLRVSYELGNAEGIGFSRAQRRAWEKDVAT
jgi:Zn-dependent peptidase ImmA (M78 family)